MLKILIQTIVALVQVCRSLEKFDFYQEMEFPNNSSKTSDNICAVDWGAIPGVLRVFCVLEKDGMCASVLACGCLSFFEKAVIFSNGRARGQ